MKLIKYLLTLTFIIFSFTFFTAELYDRTSELALTPAVKKIASKKRTKREIILSSAYSLIGVDYWPGGQDSDYGYDCSGFTQYVYSKAGIDIPRRAIEQYQASRKIEEALLKKGDLVFFNSRGYGVNHVGIYSGKGKFIHSPGIGKTIKEDTLDTPYWHVRFMTGGSYTK
ncbi:MAG: C40 family peptidase [bacterium]